MGLTHARPRGGEDTRNKGKGVTFGGTKGAQQRGKILGSPWPATPRSAVPAEWGPGTVV